MFERLVEIYQEVNSALCCMDKPDMCLTQSDVGIIKEATVLLKPFEEATKELSAERFVSVSKVIPLARMLQKLTARSQSTALLKQNLLNSMTRRFSNMESSYILAASTVLDPRFKKLGFGDATACSHAIERSKADVASTMAANITGQESSNTIDQGSNEEQSDLWSMIDDSVAASNSRPSSASSIIIFRSFLDEPNLPRKEDPLLWWKVKQQSFSALAHHAGIYLSIPASSVPAERVFSKAGELTSLRRNRIKSKNVDMILFLNKGRF